MDSTTYFDFRPPQFSDEFTWLPDWLQQSQSQRPGHEEESGRPLEVVPLSTKISNGANLEDLRENDEARCADFQLFLSGEDSSPINFSPYPARINHFFLRLSFTGPSQQSESQATNEAEAVVRLSKDFLVEKIRSTTQPSAKTSAQGNPCRKSGRHVKDDDLDASVDLSIVASEAVLIHELAESEPALRHLPTESVVEIAMRVKEARLQKIDDASDVLLEDACAEDSLMDLDDLTMLDAFQDVGLPMVVHDESEFCDAHTSQVQETPVVELHKTIDCEYECLDIRLRTCRSSGQSDSLTELALEEQSNGKLSLKSLSFQMVQDVLKELPSKGSLLLPREKGMDAAVLEKRDLTMCIPKLFVCETSFLSESADVSQNQNSVAQKPETYIGATTEVDVFLHDFYYVANNCVRFSQEVVGSQSTPLADPLCSVVPCSIPNEINDTLELPAIRLSVENSSYLSESADVSQNQNSVAQKPETYIGATSEVNVFLHDFYCVANNCIRFSQEVVGSQSTPLADPLCSVVPSSIPNEINDTLVLPAIRLSVEISSDSKSLFCSGSGNLSKTTQERNELAKDSTEPEEDCHNQTGFRRSFLSLKTFSVLPSSCETKLENTRFVPILPGYSRLIPPVDFLKYNRRLAGKLCAEGATAVASVKGGRFNNIEHSTGKIMHTKSISGECMKDAADLLLCEKQERKPSLITDDRKIHLFPQAFDLSRVCSQRNEDKLVLTPPDALKVCLRKKFLQMKLQHNYLKIRPVPGRKRVRFSGVDVELPVGRDSGNISTAENKCTLKRSAKRMKHFNCQVDHPPQDMKNLGRLICNDGTPSLFDGIGFLLAGFSRCREKEIEILIHKHGGVVIFDVPSTITRGKSTSNVVFKHWLVVISPKKLKTTKFLYGCAVGALLLKLSWIMDSIAAGSTLPPENYRILSNRRDVLIMDKAKSFHRSNAGRIFSKVGFVLHGKRRFFMKFAKVIKHGGGEAYGNLHELIKRLDGGKVFTGIIVTEYDKRPSRHLHQCAAERKIVMMPASWLIASLYSGELLPLFDEHSLELSR